MEPHRLRTWAFCITLAGMYAALVLAPKHRKGI